MPNNDFWLIVRRQAEKAVCCYARDIIEVETLAELMIREWEMQHAADAFPSQVEVARIAQRLCSRALYEAWRSPDENVCNRAFEAMRSYLSALLQARNAMLCQGNFYAADDILNQTLETLHCLLTRGAENAGPNEPAAFLKWIEIIMRRKASAYVKKDGQDVSISLDEQVAQSEDSDERWEDECNPDPLKHLLREELQQGLTAAIHSLRNPNYKQVLVYSFLEEMDESELARRLNAPVDKIYLWKHRALNALRKNQQVMQELRLLASR